MEQGEESAAGPRQEERHRRLLDLEQSAEQEDQGDQGDHSASAHGQGLSCTAGPLQVPRRPPWHTRPRRRAGASPGMQGDGQEDQELQEDHPPTVSAREENTSKNPCDQTHQV